MRSIVRSNAAFSAAHVTWPVVVDAPERVERRDRRSVGSGPARVGLGRPRLEDAEQVVDAVVERERVALEVEEQVARARLGKAEQAPVRHRVAVGVAIEWQELPQHLVPVLGLHLDPRLVLDPLERPGADALELRVHRQRQDGEPAAGRHLSRLERPALARRSASDQAQVVIRSPLGLAHDDPAADVAVLDRLGVRRDRRIGGWRDITPQPDGGLEVGPDPAVVRHVVLDPQRVRGTFPAAEHDVEPLRLDALDRRQLVDVRADLQDGRGLDVAGELGVGDLVVPRAKRAVGLTGDMVVPEEEVRVARQVPSKNVAW